MGLLSGHNVYSFTYPLPTGTEGSELSTLKAVARMPNYAEEAVTVMNYAELDCEDEELC